MNEIDGERIELLTLTAAAVVATVAQPPSRSTNHEPLTAAPTRR
jgi:hypothetical protein